MSAINFCRTAKWCEDDLPNQPELEWELEVEIHGRAEFYHGSGEPDDPSECAIRDQVKVLKDCGPFRAGDILVLTEDERHLIEEILWEEHVQEMEDEARRY